MLTINLSTGRCKSSHLQQPIITIITVVVGWMISVRTSLAPRVTVRGVVTSVVRVSTRVTASVTSRVERMAGGSLYRLARLATGLSEGTILTALRQVS